MLTNRKVTSMNLDEELEAIGLSMGSSGVAKMATTRLEDRVIAASLGPIFEEQRNRASGFVNESIDESDGGDLIDGKFATRELLNRMIDLPFDQMTESDFDDLITAFGEKEIAEGDDELVRLCEAMGALLVEKRISTRFSAGKKIHTKKTSSQKKIKGKRYRKKAGAKRAAKKLRRKKAKGKISKAEKKTAMRHGKTRQDIIRAAKGAGAKKMGPRNSDLAVELRSLLDESQDADTPFADAQNRLYRVFELISEMAESDAVTDVLQETWDDFTTSITEDADEESFMEAIKPCLRVIKRCLEDFEDGELSEMYGKHGKNGKMDYKTSHKNGKGKKSDDDDDDDDDDVDEDDDEGKND